MILVQPVHKVNVESLVYQATLDFPVNKVAQDQKATKENEVNVVLLVQSVQQDNRA